MTDAVGRLELEAELVEIQDRVAELEAGEAGQAEPDELDGLRRRAGEIEALLAEIDAALEPVVLEGEVVDADPEDFEPHGRDLVIAEPVQTFAVLDRHDELAVLQELKRRGVKRLFYDFGKGSDRKVDLSIYGVLEAVGLMNRTGKVQIRVDRGSLKIERETIDGEDYYVAQVFAEELVTGFGVFGVARQPLRMKVKPETAARMEKEGKTVVDGKIFDEFARTKVASKAQRNALGQCVPQLIRGAMIAWARQDAQLVKVIEVGVGAADVAELPPPAQGEEADGLRAEIEAAYVELRTIAPMAKLPGRYHAELRAAEHSVETLRAFRDSVRSQTDHERAKAAS